MGKKKRLREKKACGALPHTTGLTKEQYFDKLTELGLDPKDRFPFSPSVKVVYPTLNHVCDFCNFYMNEMYEEYGDFMQYYYLIPRDKEMTTFCLYNPDVFSCDSGFVPNWDEEDNERYCFMAFIQGNDGKYYMYGDADSEGSGTSAA